MPRFRLTWLVHLSTLSAWVAALGFCLTVRYLGPYLAMGILIYGGTTEPSVPALPFPWLAAGGLLGLSALFAAAELRGAPRALAWLGFASALGAGGVGLAQLLRLVDAARP